MKDIAGNEITTSFIILSDRHWRSKVKKTKAGYKLTVDFHGYQPNGALKDRGLLTVLHKPTFTLRQTERLPDGCRFTCLVDDEDFAAYKQNNLRMQANIHHNNDCTDETLPVHIMGSLCLGADKNHLTVSMVVNNSAPSPVWIELPAAA